MEALGLRLADSIRRQIDATDGHIDRLVCELYRLTDDEIRIAERAARWADDVNRRGDAGCGSGYTHCTNRTAKKE